ncbi:holin family protein [Pseudohalocynthiibacter aestuariivivens]|jgi:Holin of 3TMs, for gene-transfer release|uniref:Holin family protein n=1 Tax=Pseudohalocynthiibacter aestuariivivens TaxID=1591409 RepID=A0ABV5JFL0_9RHOB|nr:MULTISPECIES: holin family protein [Pseudohalocynthiibacter]MBS9716418.1 holin family protein [Pseudohalocynthiibacter aestuariivivens]MCK0100773.1 holin family protein [Pseudohalocynthiibacter sp. F2068]
MGLIGNLLELVFGGGRNVVRETAEVFRENAEAGAKRDAEAQERALDQLAKEFSDREKGRFDRVMDGVNRMPRPAMAFGILLLFTLSMTDPVWFASRMQGLSLVPEPLWWLLGAIVSFYFGARHQFVGQEFQRSIAQSLARVPQVVENNRALQTLATQTNGVAKTDSEQSFELGAIVASNNPALEEWRRLTKL